MATKRKKSVPVTAAKVSKNIQPSIAAVEAVAHPADIANRAWLKAFIAGKENEAENSEYLDTIEGEALYDLYAAVGKGDLSGLY